jgi:type VI secretion system FHA domain protein
MTPTVEGALTLLIGPTRPGYMPGVRAVKEGFRDIKAHELALVAGMQAAVSALLRQFDPEQLKGRLDKHSLLGSLLPATRKAKYWEVYEQQYRQIAGDVSEDVSGVFGRAFARAYEEQIEKLSS